MFGCFICVWVKYFFILMRFDWFNYVLLLMYFFVLLSLFLCVFYQCFSYYAILTTFFLGFFVVHMKLFSIIFLNPLRSLDFIDFLTLHYFNLFYLFCCLFNIYLYLYCNKMKHLLLIFILIIMKTIYSTDLDLEQSNFIVMEDNKCLWIDRYEDEDKVIVYFFDLLTDVENWINLDDINNSCDTNYTIDGENDFIMLTNDVCWYYGAINFDGLPSEYTNDEFNKMLKTLNN